jgi:hypothetical protein
MKYCRCITCGLLGDDGSCRQEAEKAEAEKAEAEKAAAEKVEAEKAAAKKATVIVYNPPMRYGIHYATLEQQALTQRRLDVLRDEGESDDDSDDCESPGVRGLKDLNDRLAMRFIADRGGRHELRTLEVMRPIKKNRRRMR